MILLNSDKIVWIFILVSLAWFVAWAFDHRRKP